jgi:hypothetical protein
LSAVVLCFHTLTISLAPLSVHRTARMTFLYAPDSHTLAYTELVNPQTAAIRVTSAVAGVSSEVLYQQDGNTIRVNWQGQFRNAYARDSLHKPFVSPTNITHDPHSGIWNLANLGELSYLLVLALAFKTRFVLFGVSLIPASSATDGIVMFQWRITFLSAVPTVTAVTDSPIALWSRVSDQPIPEVRPEDTCCLFLFAHRAYLTHNPPLAVVRLRL